MIDYVKLQVRRDRLAFAGLPAAVAATLVLAAAIGAARGDAAQRSVDATMLFWSALGLPLTAFLFGGVGGSGLRARWALDAPLPLSPRRRVFGAALAGGVALMAFGAALSLLAWVVSPGWREAAGSDAFVLNVFVPYMRLCGFFSLYAYALAFGFSYLSANGAAGALAATPLAGACAFASTLCFAAHEVFPERAPFWTGFVFSAALAAWGWTAALGRAAESIERARPVGARGWLAAAALLLGGPVIFLVLLPVTVGRTLERLELSAQEPTIRTYITRKSEFSPAPAFVDHRAPSAGGAMFEAMSGRLVWRRVGAPEIQLMPGRRRDLLEVIDNPFIAVNASWTWDRKGRVWVARSEAGRHLIWAGKPDAPLEKVADFAAPAQRLLLSMRGDKMWVFARDGGWRAAPLEGPRTLRWEGVPYASEPPYFGWPEPETVDGERVLLGRGGWQAARRAEGSQWTLAWDCSSLHRFDKARNLTDWGIPLRRSVRGLYTERDCVMTADGIVFRGWRGFALMDWEGRVRRF